MSRRFSFLSMLSVFLFLGAVCQVSAVDPTAYQDRPILLGTSGSNVNDFGGPYCCGGTLGALVTDGSKFYILSNNHVLARVNKASVGELVIQPGLIDRKCQVDLVDAVASLSDFVRIKFASGRRIPLNSVDAAIAEVLKDSQGNPLVGDTGEILEIGVLDSGTQGPVIGLAVQKMGRTTKRTFGTIESIDTTVDIGYGRSCGKEATLVARFVNQIIVTPGSFSAGGDSGSAVVTVEAETSTKPKAVGLLFAGSSTHTIVNRIDDVLQALGVVMPGGIVQPPDPDPATVSISGRVTDSLSGDPLEGAKVAADTGESAKTDATGIYTIAAVPTGQRKLTASAKFYKSQSQSVDVTADIVGLDFALEPRKNKGSKKQSAMERVARIKQRNENRLFEIKGVIGVGVGLTDDEPVIQVYLTRGSQRATIPGKIEGASVRVVVTDPFVAY